MEKNSPKRFGHVKNHIGRSRKMRVNERVLRMHLDFQDLKPYIVWKKKGMINMSSRIVMWCFRKVIQSYKVIQCILVSKFYRNLVGILLRNCRSNFQILPYRVELPSIHLRSGHTAFKSLVCTKSLCRKLTILILEFLQEISSAFLENLTNMGMIVMLANYIVVRGVLVLGDYSVESKQIEKIFSSRSSHHGGSMGERVRSALARWKPQPLLQALVSLMDWLRFCAKVMYIQMQNISCRGYIIYTYYITIYNCFLLTNMITRCFHMTHDILMIIYYI